MTDLPPLVFIDLPVVGRTDASTRTITVRVDRITAIGDPLDTDYRADDDEHTLPERSRLVVDGDGHYLVALSRITVLDLMQRARRMTHAIGTKAKPWEHEGHAPVQHRDGRAPWCEVCGWTSPTFGRPAVQITARPR